jgi:hypothetical protein
MLPNITSHPVELQPASLLCTSDCRKLRITSITECIFRDTTTKLRVKILRRLTWNGAGVKVDGCGDKGLKGFVAPLWWLDRNKQQQKNEN